MSDATKILLLLAPLAGLVVAFAVTEENSVGTATGIYAIVGGVVLGILLARREPDPDDAVDAVASSPGARAPAAVDVAGEPEDPR